MAIRAKYRLKLLIEALVELEEVTEYSAKMILQAYDDDIKQAKQDAREAAFDHIEETIKKEKGDHTCRLQVVL